MSYFLLTWNPSKWPWIEFDDDLAEFHDRGHLNSNWSCGNTKRIRPGDRLFWLRQGVEPRGLFASGWALSEPYLANHWADESALPRQTLYVDIDFDALYPEP